MPIPHEFPSLVHGPSQVLLIAGTGLSAPTLPTVYGQNGLKHSLDKIASDLGVEESNDFYMLADAILQKLASSGFSDSECRLELAERLGMLDDRTWFGEVNIPINGNTPRHRVIARFVVEERLRSIVSLNWDALLEAALDSVGVSSSPAGPRPWKITQYATIVDNQDMRNLSIPDIFPIYKPHGCVRSLEHLRIQKRNGVKLDNVVFKLTDSEMNNPLEEQHDSVTTNIKTHVAQCPLLGIGWKASEKYLRDAITSIADNVNINEEDSVSFIDIKWCHNHSEIAHAYKKDESQSYIHVNEDFGLTTDKLMLWIQARHIISKLASIADEEASVRLEKLMNEIGGPNSLSPAVLWADSWLPAWVRLCWMSGVMQGVDRNTSKIISSSDIPITPRDTHVPLTGMATIREDLYSATKLLLSLYDVFDQFNFDRFPGGFLSDDMTLYVPLPCWSEANERSDLSSLTHLSKIIKSSGFINTIKLVWLQYDDDAFNEGLAKELNTQFRMKMNIAGFAQEGSVGWITLKDLAEKYSA